MGKKDGDDRSMFSNWGIASCADHWNSLGVGENVEAEKDLDGGGEGVTVGALAPARVSLRRGVGVLYLPRGAFLPREEGVAESM